MPGCEKQRAEQEAALRLHQLQKEAEQHEREEEELERAASLRLERKIATECRERCAAQEYELLRHSRELLEDEVAEEEENVGGSLSSIASAGSAEATVIRGQTPASPEALVARPFASLSVADVSKVCFDMPLQPAQSIAPYTSPRPIVTDLSGTWPRAPHGPASSTSILLRYVNK